MRTIYQPTGRAGEYAELAVNLYSGCEHGCTYCYAPLVVHKNRTTFHAQAALRDGLLAQLERDAQKLAGDPRPVLLCFTCDPYGPGDTSATRSAIEILHDHELSVTTLTKGGTRAMRDLDLFGPGDSYAATLTTLDDVTSRVWEPQAALPGDRLHALEEFHSAGIHTWLSLEPVTNPEATLEIIRRTHTFVDHYKIGMWNYDARAKSIDWARFGFEAEELCKSLGTSYDIKADLKAKAQMVAP